MGQHECLLLFMGLVSTVTGLSYLQTEYALAQGNNLGFNNMVMDTRTGKIYAAAVNKLYLFDKDLNHVEDVQTGPKLDNELCPSRLYSYKCDKNLTSTNAYSKGLVIDYTNERLIACVNLFHGTCQKYHLDNIKEMDTPNFLPIVANNATATTILFIAPGPLEDEKGHQQMALYIGAQRTNTGVSSSRDKVPSFASRKLSDFDINHRQMIGTKTEVVIDAQHRDQFPVYYIYGFGSEKFSYMIAIQKQSTSSENFISKIFRVCQKDKGFLSYAEVQLQCKHNDEVYNLVQAAYLGSAGFNLAKKLGIPDNEDVLYGVFSKGKPNSAEPIRKTALCIFPMRLVRRIFTQNIQSCFEGQGNTGPAHIVRPDLCRETPSLTVNDNYCGKHDVNYPIDGTIPITAEAAVAFDKTASAITVVNVSHYTVAFVGTAKGQLLKIALEAQNEGNLYDSIPVDEGYKIHPDMFTDISQNYLYVMTDFKLSKIKVYECSQYKTCKDCLGAKDPYCGWCSLENKCSLRKDCKHNEQALRWLPYVKNCTKITSVSPPKIQKELEKKTQLELRVSNLPTFSEEYQCVFSSTERRLQTTVSRMIPDKNIIMCETPSTNMLPPIPTGEDHIVMNLTIQIGGLHFVSTKFTFYDCSTHNGCSGCTMSKYDCTWCIENHLCTHNPTAECGSNKLVYDKNVQADGPHGPPQCPRIELLEKDSPEAKILVPSGNREKIRVKAVNLYDFQKENVKCFFTSLQVQVAATVTSEENGDAIIECDPVDFTYPQTGFMKVPFHIYWNSGRALDNPEKIQVTMYTCDAMAKSCGECIIQPDYYKCGWCEDTCTIEGQCQSSPQRWLPNSGTCPNVNITSISPVTGPKDGGTLLTIRGRNLGKEFSDITGAITVAGVACNPIEDLYEPPHKIVCKTQPYSRQMTGTVKVTVRNLYSTDAVQRFTYVDPRLDSVSPSKGPQSGGITVTIKGQHLNAGSKVTIKFGSNVCEVQDNPFRTMDTLICKTTEATDKDSPKEIWATFDEQNVSSSATFTYVDNPEIETVLPTRAIVSGGITITVTGKHFDTIQTASMITKEISGQRRKRSVRQYVTDCKKDEVNVNTVFYCFSPNVTNSTKGPVKIDGVKFAYGFQLNNLFIDRSGVPTGEKFTIFPDPIFEDFAGSREKSYQSKTDNYLTINGRNLNLGFNSSDVIVHIGTGYCNVTSIDKHGNQLNCKPPKTEPSSAQNSKYPEVMVQVGRNLTRLVGYLKYEQSELLPLPVIIGLGVGGGVLVLVVIFFFVLWCIKTRENTSMKKKWQIQMDNLEVKVAKECKEAFAELQTDMTELTSDHFGQVAIPFWDYRTYCMKVLFPQDDDSHAVLRDNGDMREETEHGLKLFFQLICNKTFLLTFVRTLEANKKFSMRDRVQVASLISVALQTRMEYATEILKTLLGELIEKAVEGKNHPKLLLRRTESVAEKMLTNWFTFLLYKFLKECAGEPLFMLYQAIKQQTCKGPVDNITYEARYSLSEDKLIRQQIDYSPITVYVQDMDQFNQSHAVKVLDCDTISQVKEKILDAIYKNAPFSIRPIGQKVDLVLYAQKPEVGSNVPIQKHILSDIDDTTKQEGEFKRYNTLAHYQVPDGAYMALMYKQGSSFMDITANGDNKYCNSRFEYKRLIGRDDSYSSTRSPSLNRTATPQNVHIDIENSSNNGFKYYHLVKQHDQESNKEGDRGSKMVSEIYLTRLLATKGTLQAFVDDLFERIFSTVHRGTSLPLAIKYMFDFLDDQALLHGIQDADTVHTWKSNSLPLRFWVNVIKNPNFVFDIYKSNIVDSCLSVVAQNFMDSCSMSEHKLGKDSPSSKLLYAKDIPTYKKWVDRYYQDIKMMPAISDQDMTAMMAEESRAHMDEFNTSAALLELYKFVNTYNEELKEALEDDEFAKKNKLNFKLDQVREVMQSLGYP